MASKQSASQLVQYIALRGDLLRVQRWPVGALVAQGCHASTAVLHMYRDHGNVVQYLSDLDHMHKVVLEVCDIVTKWPSLTHEILVDPMMVQRSSKNLLGVKRPGNDATHFFLLQNITHMHPLHAIHVCITQFPHIPPYIVVTTHTESDFVVFADSR